MVLETVFWVSIFLLAYVYIGYPLLIWTAANIFGTDLPALKAGGNTSVTVLVPAHNEEAVIEQKIKNLLSLDYPVDCYEILVVSDGSTDKTNEIASRYAEKYPGRVRLYLVSDRKGKTNGINESMATVDSDITVFTDANVMLDEKALIFLNADFGDASIGGVAGQLSYINESVSDAAASNGLYWRYEEVIKESESKLGSIMGADGSIFAIRTALYSTLPLHVLDDFCTSMGIVLKGFKFRFDKRVKAYEKGAESGGEEFQRKVRISNRSYNSYRFLFPWSRLDWLDRWKFFSHKWLRWHSISLMMFTLFSSGLIAVSMSNSLFFAAFFAQILGYLYAYLKHICPNLSLPLIGTIYYFVSANFACGIGIFQSLQGKKTTIWQKATSTRV